MFARPWLYLHPIAHRRGCRRRRATGPLPYGLLCHRRVLYHKDVILLMNGPLAPLHSVLDVSGIAVDDDILGFGYPSGEGGPIGRATMSRPCARNGVNTFA